MIITAAVISLGWMISSMASCEAKVQSTYYEKKHENNKALMEHEKWLLENGHTMGESIIK